MVGRRGEGGEAGRGGDRESEGVVMKGVEAEGSVVAEGPEGAGTGGRRRREGERGPKGMGMNGDDNLDKLYSAILLNLLLKGALQSLYKGYVKQTCFICRFNESSV